MKIKGHQSFHIRRGWIYKGLNKVRENNTIFLDKSKVLTDEFGIGSNMIVALKYWLEALNLIERKKQGSKTVFELTDVARIILKYDPYLEDIETWQLLHYNLATNEELATTWYWFFNEYKGSRFNRENLLNNLNSYILKTYNKEVSERSLKDDISCLLNTYISKSTKTPEDNIESPFAELGLISVTNKKNGEVNYIKTHKYEVNKYIAYFMLLSLSNNKEHLDLKNIIESKNSLGNIFNLDSYEVMDLMESLQNEGLIKIIRTGGLDYITFLEKIDTQEVLAKIYG